MRIRFENRGIHFYNRISGYHILLRELQVSKDLNHKGPRVISIALTNECNFNCPFCYSPKDLNILETEYIIDICNAMDSLGVLEVAFGGGEPLLYPEIGILIKTIWNSTNLGISITTNGHGLNSDLVNELEGNISIIRVSVDAMEPLYSEIRGQSLSQLYYKISLVKGRIPLGINMVVNKNTIHHLEGVLEFSKKIGATNLLLLPEVRDASFTLSNEEWQMLESWINNNWKSFPLEITKAASDYIDCPLLFNSDRENNSSYRHIGADKKIRESSYTRGGVLILNGVDLIHFFNSVK